MTDRGPVDTRRWAVVFIGCAALAAFLVLRVVVALGGHEPLVIDVWWHDAMLSWTSDAGIVIAWIPAIVGGTVGMIVVGSLLILVLVWRGRRWDAATLAIAMVTVVAIGAPMAALIARTRPADSLAERMATSFPSGHTAVATTVAVTLGLLIRRWYIWVAGAAWVLLMMWSRTYLQAHWVSDVVAGMLEGVVVATAVWLGVELVRDRRAARAIAAPDPHSSTEGPTPS